MSREKIGYVNGLRAIAIAMVIVHHLMLPIVQPANFAATNGWTYFLLQPFVFNGWLGVNIFFVLSGFVLFLPYAKADGRPFSTRKFYVRRAKRLMPLYYANVAVCLLLFAGEPLARILQHAGLYLFALLPSPQLFFPPNNPPLWSLGLEIWFSVLLPVILIFMRWSSRPWAILLLISLASVAYHAVGSLLFQEQGKLLNDFADMLPGRLSDFCVGMAAAVLWQNGNLVRFPKAAVGLAMAAIFYLGLLLSTARYVGDVPPVAQTLANLAISIPTGYAILAFRGVAEGNTLRAALEIRIVQVIGMMCFSIYIWHWQVLHGFNYALGGVDWAAGPMVLAYLGVLALVSIASYRFIEFPREDARSIFLLPPRGELVETSSDKADASSRVPL